MAIDLKTLMTRVMVGIIIAAQPLDVWTTNRALASSDDIVEANPIGTGPVLPGGGIAHERHPADPRHAPRP